MVPIRFSSLLIGLLLACAFLKNSMAYAHQDAQNASTKNKFVENGGDGTSVNQGLSNDVIPTRLQDTRIKGRKMMMEKVTRNEMMKDLGLNGGSAEISGANHTYRKCENEREKKINVESKLRCISLLHMKLNVVGPLSFTADYYVPRPHPPKNN